MPTIILYRFILPILTINVLESESKILIDWFSFNCMQANPNKFQAIAVGKRKHDKSPVFNFGPISVNCDEIVKLLGIDIDFKLSFDSHISSICKKAAQQLNILRRIGNRLSKLNKLAIFHTFILSNFNFCTLAWQFCTEGNTKKMENIQERALKFVYDDFISSYEEFLNKINLPTLHVRRMRTMAIEVFKILHLCPPALSNLVQKKGKFISF